MEHIIANIAVLVIVGLILGLSIRTIVKAKKSGAHCMGCPSSGSCKKCECSKKE